MGDLWVSTVSHSRSVTWSGRDQYRGNRRAYNELRQQVLTRDGHVCQVRGPHCTGVGNTLDHIVAVAEGGSLLDPTNCQAACQPCNTWRGHKLGAARVKILSGKWSRAW